MISLSFNTRPAKLKLIWLMEREGIVGKHRSLVHCSCICYILHKDRANTYPSQAPAMLKPNIDENKRVICLKPNI